MFWKKRAISPVVAVALILVLAVVAVVGFGGWFNNFVTQLTSDTQTKSDGTIGATGIQDLIGNDLYFYSGFTNNISIISINIEDTDCSISQNAIPGINTIDVTACVSSLSNGQADIAIVTNKGVYSKSLYYSG